MSVEMEELVPNMTLSTGVTVPLAILVHTVRHVSMHAIFMTRSV